VNVQRAREIIDGIDVRNPYDSSSLIALAKAAKLLSAEVTSLLNAIERGGATLQRCMFCGKLVVVGRYDPPACVNCLEPKETNDGKA